MDGSAAPNESSPQPSRPLVTVVTATWQRHDNILGALETVQLQSYRPIEHIFVSDGPDPWLATYLPLQPLVNGVHRRYVELGFNTTTMIPDSYAVAPTLVGALLARGEYITYLPDDDRMEPDHVELLVKALEDTGCDFVYPKGRHIRNGHETIIGGRKLGFGQVPVFLHKRSLLSLARWQFGDDTDNRTLNDWRLIQRWITAGAKPAFLDRVTFTHVADH